ncbi:efflux RND transporter periplasmic adaptor subunit [Paenibacillus sp. LjRoot153]|uniref:efflux RND transporter periplasmic adaptor subunit n=1 Tax=Paenibacillus sp. LjRoot153 TaxID=3342270 RepID=UPI003ECDBBFE
MRQKRRKPQSRTVRIASILTLSIGILAGCSDTAIENTDANSVYTDQSQQAVRVFKVIKQKIGDSTERVAEVQFSAQFKIMSKTTGEIEQIMKKRGDMVQEGDVILKLKSSEMLAGREAAATSVKTLQDAIEKAKVRGQKETDNQKSELSNGIQKMELGMASLVRSYNKMKNDFDIGLATKAQLYQMETQMMNARMDLDQMKVKLQTLEPVDITSDLESQLKAAKLTLQQVEQSIQNLEVKATVSGLMTEMPFEAGMGIQSGAQIAMIQRLDPIKIKSQLSDEEMKLTSGKTEMSYFLPNNKTKYQGAISYLSKVIDPETKAYEINLEVPNKDLLLKPGMKLKLQLSEEKDLIVVTVPTYSIVKEGDNAYVYVLSGDTVEKRNIQLGRVNEPKQEVLSGLKEGEMVVKSNPSALMDKAKVQVAAVEEQ